MTLSNQLEIGREVTAKARRADTERPRRRPARVDRMHLLEAALRSATRKVIEEAFDYYPRLQKVRSFVLTGLSRHISLREAAGVAAYETTYFCSLFRRRVGVPFARWLTITRVRKAAELMQTQDYYIWEVARATGFRSVRAFERAFKGVVGLSPRQFKSNARPS